ncbi:MAG TPA: hypothetical protein VKZ18_20345 [Polyangia bacterium]|nr:hypothetical protein [Polyangia bacterium]
MKAPLRSGLLGIGALVTFVSIGRSALGADASPGTDAIARTGSPAATAVATRPAAPDATEWSVSAAAGPVIAAIQSPACCVWPLSFGLMSTAWEVELQARPGATQFIGGVRVAGTYDRNGAAPQLLGVDVFAGRTWRHRRWALEATLGLGLEAAQFLETNVLSGDSFYQTIDYHPSYEIGAYARGTVAAAVPVGDSVAVLLRLGVHITGAHDEDWFGSSTVGLRYTLP